MSGCDVVGYVGEELVGEEREVVGWVVDGDVEVV